MIYYRMATPILCLSLLMMMALIKKRILQGSFFRTSIKRDSRIRIKNKIRIRIKIKRVGKIKRVSKIRTIRGNRTKMTRLITQRTHGN
jgi:hypothetical protein